MNRGSRSLGTIFLLALPLFAQIPDPKTLPPMVTISPQGNHVLARTPGAKVTLKSFQLVSVFVQSPGACQFDGIQLFTTLASAGFSVSGPAVTNSKMNTAVSQSWASRAVIALTVIVGVGTIAVGGGLVNVAERHRARATAILGAATAGGALLIPMLRAQEPDPTPLLVGLITPGMLYSAPVEGVVGAVWPSPPAVVVPLVGGCR